MLIGLAMVNSLGFCGGERNAAAPGNRESIFSNEKPRRERPDFGYWWVGNEPPMFFIISTSSRDDSRNAPWPFGLVQSKADRFMLQKAGGGFFVFWE